jgi:general secretion pathway protein M
MTSAAFPPIRSNHRQALSAMAYLAIVLGLLGAAYAMAVALLAEEADADLLRLRASQLASRAKPHQIGNASESGESANSPFLEGQTVTIAGAALQQRIEQAVATAHGVLLSSQVDLDGSQSKNGFLGVAATIEITQPALQSLLYDLESGLPFVFIDSFEIQAPEAGGSVGVGRVRVTMSVSGQWGPAS